MPDRIKAPAIKSPNEFEIKLVPYQQFNLKNDAPVYCVHGGAEEVMKIEWVFSSGNYYEDKIGVASATNRLIRTGTSKRTSFDISRHFEFYGAFLSLACYNEYAVITLETLSKYLGEVLPVVAEIFTDAVFPEKEIDIYIQNSIQHLKVNLKKCDFVADRNIDEILYGKSHPYGKKASAGDYSKLTRDDLTLFYQKYYKEGKFKIFTSGMLPDNLENLLNQYFGEMKENDGIEVSKVKRHLSEQKKSFIEVNKEGVQSAIRIGRPFPTEKIRTSRKRGAEICWAGFLGSRLMSNLRKRNLYLWHFQAICKIFYSLVHG